jgi:hypothetical protein
MEETTKDILSNIEEYVVLKDFEYVFIKIPRVSTQERY